MKPGNPNKLILLAGCLAIAACDARVPERDETGEEGQIVEESEVLGPDAPGVTPMAERVAVIGLLNKRNGIVTDLEMRPGQARQVGDAIVRLRACEKTAPWEPEKLTGAFIQLDVRQREGRGYDRVFSGWVYAESPSLNVVEHPVFDAWPKSCTMSFPEGPPPPSERAGSSSIAIAPSDVLGAAGGGEDALVDPLAPTAPEPATPAPATPPALPDDNA